MILNYDSIITQHAFLILFGLFETVTITHYTYGDLNLDVKLLVDGFHKKRLDVRTFQAQTNPLKIKKCK